MLSAVAVVSMAAWVYLIAFRGRFWRSGPVLRAESPSGKAKVAAVVPARNEAEHVAPSLRSLLEQDDAGGLAIVLVDDGSTDGTAEIAGAVAASLDGGGRLTLVRGEPLPEGWSGKLWAVQQGLSQAGARAANFVLLTDADIEHARSHVAALVARAEREGLDLVSEMVRLHCETAAERALIPAFVFFFQMLYPFAWVADPRKRTAGAAGGTMLVRRAALDRVEGVLRIRNKLIDDCALAREIKRTGGRIWLGHAEGAASLRVYGWSDAWNIIARTAYAQLGYSPLILLGCVAGMAVVYCAPPLSLVFGRGKTRVLGALAWGAMAAAFQPTLRRYRRSPWWGLALPAIGLFYLGATVASAVRHYAGRGGGWKERVYAMKQGLRNSGIGTPD
ncbi:MAG TPA: glycosyltransferase [Terracidiphilus sp.]|nr:glycosyltransferase [Terracidiphilus sp.]